jgi:O-antigen/teichoic acid export membrane protein
MSSADKNLPDSEQIIPQKAPGRGRLLVRNTLASASSAVFAQLLALITFPLLLRQVGATDYGIYALAASSVGYFSILNLAARTSVVKYTAELPETDQDSLNRLFSNAFFINVCMGLLLAVILFLLAAFCQDLFTIEPAGVPRARQILLINAAAVILTQPLSVYESLLFGFQKYGVTSLVSAIWTVLRNAAIFILYFGNGSILWLVWAEVLLQLFRFSVLALAARRRYPFIAVSWRRLDAGEIKKIFTYGGWSVVYTISLIMVYQGSIILTGILLSVAAITYLQIGYKLFNLVYTIALNLNFAVLPSSSAALAEGDDSYLRGLVISGSKINLSILLPLTISVLYFAPQIIGFWIGPQFVAPSMNLSRLMLASWFLLAPTMFLTQLYLGQQDIGRLARTALVGVILQVGLAVLLGSYLGLPGVALAFALFYGFLALRAFFITTQKLRFSPGLFFSRVLYPAYGTNLAFAGIMALFVFYVGQPGNITQLLVIFISALSLGVGFNLLLNARAEACKVSAHIISDFFMVFRQVTCRNVKQ